MYIPSTVVRTSKHSPPVLLFAACATDCLTPFFSRWCNWHSCQIFVVPGSHLCSKCFHYTLHHAIVLWTQSAVATTAILVASKQASFDKIKTIVTEQDLCQLEVRMFSCLDDWQHLLQKADGHPKSLCLVLLLLTGIDGPHDSSVHIVQLLA